MMDFIAKTQQRPWLPPPGKHGTKLVNHQGKLAVCISLSRHVAAPFLETLIPESSIFLPESQRDLGVRSAVNEVQQEDQEH